MTADASGAGSLDLVVDTTVFGRLEPIGASA